ncbi:MAG: heavy-metal-associated domain-containing protein [Rhodospirillales bacterium]|nr:MAG: heavy-metal-associated domain-containing protein [Rhodospirillales bacterium]
MSRYVHHVPGRLRIRTPAIKRRPEAAETARRCLSAIDGVIAAEASALTGSITLRYDPARIGHQDLVGVLRGHGYAAHDIAATGTAPAAGASDGVANQLVETAAKTVAVVLLEKLIERSTVAVIGALT